MTTAKPSYGAATALTITLASLASSAGTGRQSAVIDNTADLADDSIVTARVTTGTSPTVGNIQIYTFGSVDGSTFTANMGTIDQASSPVPLSCLKLLEVIPTTTSSNQIYVGGPYSIANAFGGTMPRKWGILIIQTTVANLNATAGNHSVLYAPVQYVNV